MASILLVDDHPDIRDALRAMLESDRHTVVEAEDGRGALAAWQAHKADLVLTDFSMPGLNGRDVIHAIATEHPDTPIILCPAPSAPTARRHGSPNFPRLGFCRNHSPTPRSGNRYASPFAQSPRSNLRATGAASVLAPPDSTAP